MTSPLLNRGTSIATDSHTVIRRSRLEVILLSCVAVLVTWTAKRIEWLDLY
jgi:hypothetical protein